MAPHDPPGLDSEATQNLTKREHEARASAFAPTDAQALAEFRALFPQHRTFNQPEQTLDKPDILTSGASLEHYELIRELGRGGMGTVFLARDTRLGRLVAIKILTELSGEGVDRFLAEAQATARCKHENIVIIHDVGEYDTYPYMVLEYLRGRTLRTWLEERLSTVASVPSESCADHEFLGLAVEVMVPVVRALGKAHELGIVHRDLKPENIILDDSGVIKVLDFGLAKWLHSRDIPLISPERPGTDNDGSRTQAGMLMGTLPYMSPEQWGADEVDLLSDIWAVGIILYELVFGVHILSPLTRKRLREIAALDIPMPLVSDMHPEIGPLASIIDRCLRKRKVERISSTKILLAELEALLPAHRIGELNADRNPFTGLAPFQEQDAAYFFGRDHEVASMVTRLRTHSLVALTGPSGAGKSSFVRAGVLPALKRSGERWETFTVRPGRHPLSALADVLIAVSGISEFPLDDNPEQAETLRARPGYLGMSLRARCRNHKRRVLLFVDQFEELYTLAADPDERMAFIACLEGVADDPASPLRVALAVRSDFLDRMAEDCQSTTRRFMTEVTRGLIFLRPIDVAGLREALTRPVEASNHRFESLTMVDDMLDVLANTRGPLPLLQFTAARLWEERDRERQLLTRASYNEMGGVAGALATHADTVLAGLSSGQQRLARMVFLRLVTLERTRALASLGDLRDLAEDGDAVAQVVQHLADARLLLIESEAGQDGSTVELVHESLITEWPAIAQWLDETQQDAQFVNRLMAAAKQWQVGDGSEDLLWRGRAVEDARRWLERWQAREEGDVPGALGDRERQFLVAVVAYSERTRRRRRRIAVGAFMSLVAIALVVSFLALRARREAVRVEQQKTEIEHQAAGTRNMVRMLAARNLLHRDPTFALALVREVEPSESLPDWPRFVRRILNQGVAHTVIHRPTAVRFGAFSPDGTRMVTVEGKSAQVWSADGYRHLYTFEDHEDTVHTASFSPDSARIVTASYDHTARVWNADGSGQPLVLRGHQDRVYSAAFSADGRRIVTASRSGNARVWSVVNSTVLHELRGHTDAVYSAAFSPDSTLIATASSDRTVRVWSADDASELRMLRGHEDEVFSVAFGPDGTRMVTASFDGTARVWHVDGTEPLQVLRGHQGDVRSARFSPDNTRIVTASEDKTVRVWRAADGWQERELHHQDAVYSAVFSPDGARIVSGSLDKTVRVWRMESPGLRLQLKGHTGHVRSVTFSPDGVRVLTGAEDMTARVWRIDGTGSWQEPVFHHPDRVKSVAFSPDGTFIATGSSDRLTRVFGPDGPPILLSGHEDVVLSVAFSPDGRYVVTGSRDGTARVYRADGTGQPSIFKGHNDRVYAAAFSPDGTHIVTASRDRSARIWRVEEPDEQPSVFTGHQGSVYSAVFAPDGTRIATASGDETARIWNTGGTGEPIVLTGHESAIGRVAFSSDGTRVVTASDDKTVRIWNADGTGKPIVLEDPTNEPVNAAVFSPDGNRIASASDGKSAWIWTDIEPFTGLDDTRLWTATSYCMPVGLREQLLGFSREQAAADRERCQQRVTTTTTP